MKRSLLQPSSTALLCLPPPQPSGWAPRSVLYGCTSGAWAAEKVRPVHKRPLLTPRHSEEHNKTEPPEFSSICSHIHKRAEKDIEVLSHNTERDLERILAEKHKTQPSRHRRYKVMHLDPSMLHWSTRQELLIHILTHQNTLGHSAAFPQTAPSAGKAAVAHMQLGHGASTRGLAEKLCTPPHRPQQGLDWLVSGSNAIVKYYRVARKNTIKSVYVLLYFLSIQTVLCCIPFHHFTMPQTTS